MYRLDMQAYGLSENALISFKSVRRTRTVIYVFFQTFGVRSRLLLGDRRNLGYDETANTVFFVWFAKFSLFDTSMPPQMFDIYIYYILQTNRLANDIRIMIELLFQTNNRSNNKYLQYSSTNVDAGIKKRLQRQFLLGLLLLLLIAIMSEARMLANSEVHSSCLQAT